MNRDTIRQLNTVQDAEGELRQRFVRTDDLTKRKIKEYLPAMIITNLSVLLLVTVDGLVVGNFVGSKALSSVNIFTPATLLVSVASSLVATGAATSLSTCMGSNDLGGLQRVKFAVKRIMVVAALLTSVVQIPIIWLIITSYHLTPEMNAMVWSYAVGLMIATPLGMISSVGTYQLQIIGKMKVLMYLSALEGICNLILDLFFVSVMDMGTAGAGYGTACSNLLRCIITVVYLAKKTDIYRCQDAVLEWKWVREILSCGLPEASNALMLALQNYCIMRIVLAAFGDDGGVIKGVTAFAFSIVNVFILGMLSSMRPLLGLYSGARDSEGLLALIRHCMYFSTAVIFGMTVVIWVFPTSVYYIHGVREIPEGGLLALRLFALFFVFKGLNSQFRLYFANRKDSKFATGLTIVGNATMPLFALGLSMCLPPPFVWLSYLMTELLILVLNIGRFRQWTIKDKKALDPDATIFSMSVLPEDAITVSRLIRAFAKENGYPSRPSFRLGLCLEEMIAYAVASQGSDTIQIQLVIRLTRKDAVFMMLDDGACCALDEDRAAQELFTNNYELIKQMASSVEYQYILNMNYTTLYFD